jgi:hypothetical protein
MVMSTSDGTTRTVLDAPDVVLKLLREQAASYDRLEALSNRQRSLVSDDDVGPLLALLVDRQKISDQLTQIAARLAPVRCEWVAFRTSLTPVQRAEADRLLGDAGDRLRRIIEHDEQDARILSGRKQSACNALRTTHSTSQAISAYRVVSGRTGRLDCVDEGT